MAVLIIVPNNFYFESFSLKGIPDCDDAVALEGGSSLELLPQPEVQKNLAKCLKWLFLSLFLTTLILKSSLYIASLAEMMP